MFPYSEKRLKKSASEARHGSPTAVPEIRFAVIADGVEDGDTKPFRDDSPSVRASLSSTTPRPPIKLGHY
uniref:Uncharacterized protein n=1 Tax=Arundo donax TaxID=35708 RepID=A0A0A9ET56_ARUDO